MPQRFPDLTSRGSTDVVSFGRSFARNSIPWGEGVQVGLWVECQLLSIFFFNVLLARQLLGLEKALEVHLLKGRALISRTHAALTTAASFEVGGKPEMFGEFCR